jgi:hypothetical protein
MCPKILIIMMLAIAASVVMFIGCEGPEGPRGPAGTANTLPVYVVARIGPYPMYRGEKNGMDSTTEARVDVYESPGIPSVEINGIRIPPSDPFYRGCNPFRFYNDNLPVSCGDSVRLLVTYPRSDGTPGTAHASIMLPGQFEITSPDTSYDTISVGDSLAFRWTPSNGADAYIADFRLGYSYWDTSGNQQFFQYYVYDMVLTDTSITFSQAQLFPDLEEIDSLEYGYGGFDLWAMNGPTPEEDQGNVTGDGIGFFNGWTYGGSVNIRIIGSSSPAGEIMQPQGSMQRLSVRQW